MVVVLVTEVVVTVEMLVIGLAAAAYEGKEEGSAEGLMMVGVLVEVGVTGDCRVAPRPSTAREVVGEVAEVAAEFRSISCFCSASKLRAIK